jgi:hypothetical protein
MLTQGLTSRTVTRLAGLTAVGVVALSFAPSAQAQPQTCPGTFHVLHNDRIGSLRIAEGHYTITVLDAAQLSCASASDLFRQFLEDYDGRLQRPWVLNPSTFTFRRGRSRTGFSVGPANTPSGGGGGGRHPYSGTSCPGYFQVLHNDHIGRLSLAAGPYRITLLSAGRLSCAQASSLFASFLQLYTGRLPFPWRLDLRTATFFTSLHVGFRVKPAVGPPTRPASSGRHPSDGTRCPGFFRVLNNDRIGALRLRAGNYIVTTLRGGNVSCSQASSLFRRFLSLPMGNLPSPWVLNTRTATFTRGRGSSNGFRVKPAR